MTSDQLYIYKAKVVRVVDGDTLDVDVDLGMNIRHHMRARIASIDAPEIYGVKKESSEYEAGLLAADRARELVEGKDVFIRTHRDRKGKYGRYIVDVFLDESLTETLSQRLIDEGLVMFE